MFPSILPDTLVQAGGWTILHSLWQGAIITLLLAFILGRTRQQSPALRYQLSVGALFLLLGAVVFTFFQYYQPASGAGAMHFETGAFPETYVALESVATTVAGKDFPGQFFPLLLQVWLVGVVLMGLKMLGELVYLHRLRSVNTQLVAGPWLERLNGLKWQMGILQPVEMRESLRVSSPMLVGWLKPVILLPVGLLSGLSPQQVECVLAHELAHVHRMDYLVNLLQSAVEVLLFFHPAVWWISAQIREEREHCCDELAVAVTGDRLTLVKTLAQLEEWRVQGGQLGLAFNGRPPGILGRVQRLLGGESSVRMMGKGLWSLLFFCLATGLLAFRDPSASNVFEPNAANSGLEPETINRERMALMAPTFSPQELAVDPRPTKKGAISALKGGSTENQFREEQLVSPLTPRQVEQLIVSGLSPLKKMFRDTVPDEKFEKEMRTLQKEMEGLQQEMMESVEMKQIQELTLELEKEMTGLQEKMMKEQGGYEKLAEEQRKVMEKVERRQQELMESGAFKTMQAEMEALSMEMSQYAEAMRQRYQDNPALLEQKMDSISRIFEKQQAFFEQQYEKTFEAMEKEIEALEASPEMKALEQKMEAMDKAMEKLMEGQMKPMEEKMEKLQQALEEKFEGQMNLLEEKMEKLEWERRKQEHRKEE